MDTKLLYWQVLLFSFTFTVGWAKPGNPGLLPIPLQVFPYEPTFPPEGSQCRSCNPSDCCFQPAGSANSLGSWIEALEPCCQNMLQAKVGSNPADFLTLGQ